jgi:hypothetical protein
VDWVSVGLDVATGITAAVGLNPLAAGSRVAKGVNFASGITATGISLKNGDGVGATLNVLGFVPGPIGVVSPVGSLIIDMSKGVYASPFIPSVTR